MDLYRLLATSTDPWSLQGGLIPDSVRTWDQLLLQARQYAEAVIENVGVARQLVKATSFKQFRMILKIILK